MGGEKDNLYSEGCSLKQEGVNLEQENWGAEAVIGPSRGGVGDECLLVLEIGLLFVCYGLLDSPAVGQGRPGVDKGHELLESVAVMVIQEDDMGSQCSLG